LARPAASTREPWLFRSPVFGSGIRRLDGEVVGGRRLARTPPRRVTCWLATSTITLPAPALSSAGMNSRPHHVYFRLQNRGAVIQALPAASQIEKNARFFMFPQRVLPLRRPHNHQLRTAIVTANWRGCERSSGRF
jgi:hypothetical protein